MKRGIFFRLGVVLIILIYFSLWGCIKEKELSPLYVETSMKGLNIPTGKESYSLFFATSQSYTKSITSDDYSKLKEQVIIFGEGIGYNNMAVWVKEPDSEKLNYEFGKILADRISFWYKMDLDYSDGPFLVFLTKHPNEKPTENDFAAAISFKNKSPKYIIESIEYLEAQIRRGKVSRFKVTLIDYWIDLKSYVSQKSDLIEQIVIKVSGKI